MSVLVAGPWEGGRRVAERDAAAARSNAAPGRGSVRALRPAAAVLSAVRMTRSDAGPELPLPTRQGLEEALGPLLNSSALGSAHSGAVMDAATGRLIYGADADAPSTPASTIKIATAVAALASVGPEHRIATTVVQGARRDEIVLVGGGDPTLTARDLPTGPDDPASLRELAATTARALKDRGTRTVRLRYDTSAYSGPELHPIGFDGNLARVTPLMADEGREDPGTSHNARRVRDPAGDAAARFAVFLRRRGVDVQGDPRPGRAARTAEGTIAEVRSPALAVLVERMLTDSDNDIAEALARQTAMARGMPASFDGGGRAVESVLRKAGLPLGAARFLDGSGLNSGDQVSAELLVRLLAHAAAPDKPALRPALTGLPVAGFSGTLANRYGAGGGGPSHAAAGLVRAKTGTLTGVNTLAGTLVDADGRLLVFAFTAKGTTSAEAATDALDRLAAAVANCGCR
ncbi:D-alanyl-D-alanine carboxypeptidase/D-alanyl-D-alanine endopeptidase [Wenjunlia tyrosinilytica]|uniref:D-alanyl-D-alanine carboxypeptidase/D-alanyl-D-alanine endopeptidase n=1 Tax=Wenjunlia tyrosinilytica TaxID=1544741 RepID=UPI001E2D1633|nr:D-alanyl-D-alanine carboxypeptidase/D-alanyl-D-alanine-endopeptidase [Wenjunlia tyrosinilytica]